MTVKVTSIKSYAVHLSTIGGNTPKTHSTPEMDLLINAMAEDPYVHEAHYHGGATHFVGFLDDDLWQNKVFYFKSEYEAKNAKKQWWHEMDKAIDELKES